MPKLRTFPSPDEAWQALEAIRGAVRLLREARDALRTARASRAHAKARTALKSVEGAARHAERVYHAHYHQARRFEDGQ